MAAGNAIGKGSVILTANADGLAAGLGRAGKDVRTWATQTNAAMGRGVAGRGLGDQLAGLHGSLAGLASAAGSEIGSALGGRIGAAVGGAVGKIGGELPGLLVGSIKDTARQGDMAKALGLTTEQFTGMAAVAESVGEGSREFLESLVTLGKLGTDAASGSGVVATQAFADLNLDAQAFIKLRADEQFFKLFDALGAVQDPLKRTRLLMNAFGEDGGKYLLPLLSKAPEDLRRMADGFAVSGSQMKAAQAAALSFGKLEQIGKSFLRDLATAAAPALERSAENIAASFKEAGPALATLIDLGGHLATDFLAPAVKSAADLATGFVQSADALARMNKEGEAGGGERGWWGTFKDAFPTPKEFGPSITAMGLSLSDAFKNATADFHESIWAMLGKDIKLTRSDEANRFLDTLNNPPAPPKPKVQYGGLLNRVGKSLTDQKMAGIYAENDRREGEFLLKQKLGDDYGLGAITSAFPALAQLGNLGSGFDKFTDKWDFTHMGGAWRNGDMTPAKAQFAGAVEDGGREAYSLRIRNQFEGEEKGRTEAEKTRKAAEDTADAVTRIEKQMNDLAKELGAI